MRRISFELFGQLLKQTSYRKLEKNVIMTIWSVAALILSSCFSGGILRSMVHREQTSIDTLDELISSNLSVVILENSWLWWQYEKQRRWNVPLEYYMSAIKPRLVSVPLDKFNNDKVLLKI